MLSLWILVVGTFLLMWSFSRRRKKPHELPGPTAIPILGNMFQVISAAGRSSYPFSYLSQQYGDIFRIQFSTFELVVLSSLKSMEGVLKHPSAFGRYREAFFSDRTAGRNLGVIASEGEVWEKTSRWVIKNLRDFGFGKSSVMQNLINREMNEFNQNFRRVQKNGEAVLKVRTLFLIPIARMLYQMMAGEGEVSELLLTKLMYHLDKFDRVAGFATTGSVISFLFPFFRHVFPEFSGKRMIDDGRIGYQQASEEILREARRQLNSDPAAVADTFAKKFVLQAQQNSTDETNPEIFEDLSFHAIFQDIIQAGSHNPSNYIDGFILHMIHFPEVQDKMYQEIMITAGERETLEYGDKQRMPYTRAVLLEVYRIMNLLPVLVPRKALYDFYYEDFLIKKGSFILADPTTVFTNPDIFPEPSVFKPERFMELNDSGTPILSKYIVAFGLGRRSCSGEQVAEVEIFLILTALIRKFQILPVPGEEMPSTQLDVAFTAHAYPFNALFKLR